MKKLILAALVTSLAGCGPLTPPAQPTPGSCQGYTVPVEFFVSRMDGNHLYAEYSTNGLDWSNPVDLGAASPACLQLHGAALGAKFMGTEWVRTSGTCGAPQSFKMTGLQDCFN